MFINIFGHFRNIADGLRVPGAVTVSERRVSAAWPAAGATIPRELSRRTTAARFILGLHLGFSLSISLPVELFTRTYPRVRRTLYVRMRRTAMSEIIERSLDTRATWPHEKLQVRVSLTSSFSRLHDVTLRRVKPPPHAGALLAIVMKPHYRNLRARLKRSEYRAVKQ